MPPGTKPPALGAGATAAGGAKGAGVAVAAPGAMVSPTTFLQAADSVVTFFCRQPSASLPPGATPEHLDMKSERHDAFIALC